MYRPELPFNVPAQILKAEYKKVNGVNIKVFREGNIINVSARTYGGTERTSNGAYIIEDTINIETWYTPDITSIDHLKLLDDNSEWEILNTPENIERKNQFLVFKCKRYKGNA